MDDFQEAMKANRAGKRTVALVGMAESSRNLAPWDDLDVEIWIMNESAHDRDGKGSVWLRRWTRAFQMHPKWDYSRPDNHNDPHHWEWLKSIPPEGQEGHFPLYMLEMDPEVPASVEYPKQAVFDKLLANYSRTDQSKIEYASSTAEYMMALACYEGFDRCELYGIEMASNTEYKDQRAGGSFWLGVIGQHMEIVLPANCSLLKAPLYGYDKRPTLNAMLVEVRIKGMFKEYQKYEGAKAELEAEILTNEKEQKAARGGDTKKIQSLRDKSAELQKQLDALAGRMNILRGHIDEAQFFYDKMEQLDASIARAIANGQRIVGHQG